MRRTREEAAATRDKIVEAAAVEFRRHGIDGSGLTGLMAAAGLTQGGFYKHFSSKAQLVAEATKVAVDGLVEELQMLLPNVESRERFGVLVGGYLSQSHRDGVAGCPYAGVGSELARAEKPVRDVALEGVERMVTLLADQLEGQSKTLAREQSLLAMCAMMGALTISRMAEGAPLADEVLEAVSNRLVRLG